MHLDCTSRDPWEYEQSLASEPFFQDGDDQDEIGSPNKRFRSMEAAAAPTKDPFSVSTICAFPLASTSPLVSFLV